MIDSPQWHTIDLEGARHEEDAFWEGLEEDDSLASEASGEKDEDSTRLERRAWFKWSDGFAGLEEVTVSLVL